MDPSIITEPTIVLLTEQFEAFPIQIFNQFSKLVPTSRWTAPFKGTGSGWIVRNLVNMDTTVWELDPLQAETYHPLFDWIQSTHCVINVKNKDECFLSLCGDGRTLLDEKQWKQSCSLLKIL